MFNIGVPLPVVTVTNIGMPPIFQISADTDIADDYLRITSWDRIDRHGNMLFLHCEYDRPRKKLSK